MKPEWQKQKEKEEKKKKRQREKKKEFRKLTIKEEMKIARIVEEKEEEDLIEIRIVEKIVPRRFYKYLKGFEKNELERMPMRKTCDYVINLRKGFMLKKKKIYLLLRIKREKVEKFIKNQLRKGYIQPSKLP